jgi:hypothetical protein
MRESRFINMINDDAIFVNQTSKGNQSMNSRMIILIISMFSMIVARANAQPLGLEAARLSNAPVSYREMIEIKQFPLPVVYWQRSGLAGDPKEIKDRIIYPLIMESKKPISSVIVEFLSKDAMEIRVCVLWCDGEGRKAMIQKMPDYSYDPNGFKVFFSQPVP